MGAWRDAKSQLIGALRPLTPEDTVRGQYEGYLDVDGVAPGSTTETYVAIGNALRFRIWPEAQVALSLVGKKPGAGSTPQQEELTFTEHPATGSRALA
jgi:glucose-6-phosphate 1-dehydrogenase